MLRPLTHEEMKAYLDELRPRILTVHVRHKRLTIRWCVPMWAIEEPLRFLLRTAHLLQAIAPGISKRIERRMGRTIHLAPTRDAFPRWSAVDAFFSETNRDLLALPGNDPLIEIRHEQSYFRIAQTRI